MTPLHGWSDGELLLALFLGLWLFEGIIRLRPEEVAFIEQRRNWQMRRGSKLLGNMAAGLAWTSLLPGRTVLVVRNRLDYSQSYSGGNGEGASPGQVFPAMNRTSCDVEPVSLGSGAANPSSLEVSESLFAAQRTTRETSCSVGDANGLSQQMNVRWDVTAAATQIEELMRTLSPLRRACRALALSALLLMWVTSPWGPAWPTLLLPVVVLACVLSWLTALAFLIFSMKRIFPTDPSKQGKLLLQALCSPAWLILSVSKISREIPLKCDPLVLASLLCDDRTFSRAAATELRILTFAPPPSDSPASEKLIATKLKQLRKLVRQRGMEPEDLLRPPPRDWDAQAYCPCCHGQFLYAEGCCPACEDVPLGVFELKEPT